MLQRYFDKKLIEAGVDEAGRGCLAGPVFAAAVILPKNFSHKLLNDSKKMKEEDRNTLREIIEKKAIAWAVASVDEHEIDKINILNATFLAMHHALDHLKKQPQLILVDGNRFIAYHKIPHQTIVKGDSLYTCIAAASVLAKTHRDEYMKKLHKKFPEYGWANNKAYGTKEHIEAIHKFGLTTHHRKTFILKSKQLEFDF